MHVWNIIVFVILHPVFGTSAMHVQIMKTTNMQ